MISITILQRRGKVGIFYITVQKKVCSYNAFAGCVNPVLDSTAVCIFITFTVTVIDVTSTNSKLLSYVGSIAIGKCCPYVVTAFNLLEHIIYPKMPATLSARVPRQTARM